MVTVNSWPAGALNTGVTPLTGSWTMAAEAPEPRTLTVPLERVNVVFVPKTPERLTKPPLTVTLRTMLAEAPTPKVLAVGTEIKPPLPIDPFTWRVPAEMSVVPE